MNRRRFLTAAGLGLAATAMSGCVHTRGTASARKKPNVLLILADDMGYSDPGCYGGEVQTPTLDRLAAHGVRFTQHYSSGRCWPSRACILTGYYAQQIRRDSMKGIRMGTRPSWAPLLPRLLKPAGYRAYHSGKWHIDGSPKQGGFDRSWGNHRGGCDWDRFFNSKPWTEGTYSAPVKEGEPYYSTVAIADHAIACMKLHQETHPNQPFFQYVAFYSPHFPLHAMKEDIDRYRQSYTDGWDTIRKRRLQRMKTMGLVNCELSKREPKTFPNWNLKPNQLKDVYGEGEVGRAVAWDTLSDAQKAFQATKMAIHAAMVTRMDHEIGRLIQQLKAMGEYENTLILVASDNGASAEQMNRGDKHHKGAPLGSATSYVCLGPGWSTAANTPFRLHKHWNHEGGISSPLIAHWPRGIKSNGELRHDPSHFIDIAPTVLDVAGIDPGQRPGISLIPAFAQDGAVKHDSLWWCHGGHRALRMGDWKLSFNKYRGEPELYNLKTDRAEMHDLAQEHPEILKKLSRQWETTTESFRKGLRKR